MSIVNRLVGGIVRVATLAVLSWLWCVAERESSLRARHHNRIQQPLNDAQMLAAWLLSIKGAHNWDCTGVIRFISRSRCEAHQCNPQLW